MTLAEAIKKIKEKNFLFEISIEGKKPFGKQTVEKAEMFSGSIEEYLKKVAQLNNCKQLVITLWAPNGSSFLRKDFFLVDMPAVVESTKSVDISTKSVDTSTTPKNIESMNVTKSDIENASLKTELIYLKQKADDLEKRNKDLERKNEEYWNQNNKLQQENSIIKDKTELECERKLHSAAQSQKNGLSGIMSEIKETPEILEFIAGFIPNHPMGKMLPAAENNQVTDNHVSFEKHPEQDGSTCIGMMIPLLNKQPGEKVGMIALIVENLCMNENNLKSIYGKLTENINKK